MSAQGYEARSLRELTGLLPKSNREESADSCRIRESSETSAAFTLEALGFLMERDCFVVTEDGRLRTVDRKVRKKVTGTDESIACQRVARFIGREFARVGDRGTIYTSLGVRP